MRSFRPYPILFFFLLFGQSLFAQPGDDDNDLVDKGKIKVKLRQARVEFLENNMRGAMNKAREVLNMDDGNAKANFLIARANYELGHFGLSEEYIEKASSGKEKIGEVYFLVRGMVHHRMEELDPAIENFETFVQRMEDRTLPKQQPYDVEDVKHFIAQCKFAKKAMKDSLAVRTENLGRNVNSRYDEYNPCVTEDEKKIIFTARRPDTKGGGVDHKGDHQYFEDIYYTEWNEENEEWSRPESVPGRVNTEGYDAVLSLSPSGETMYIYRNNPEHAGDIFRSEVSDRTGKWRRPRLLPKPVNTSYYEGSVSATKDEEKLFFISERKGGHGRGDIYVTEKRGRGEWTEPKNLGPKVNTEQDEKFVHVDPDGETLFFASNGHLGLGEYDIYRTDLKDGEWSEPVNLGYPINTVREESTFSFTPDNETLYLAGKFDENFGSRDLYRVDLKEVDLTAASPTTATAVEEGKVRLSGTVVSESDGSYLDGCSVVLRDPNSGEELHTTTTNEQGEFSFELSSGGKYLVEARAEGYRNGSEEMKLKINDEGQSKRFVLSEKEE